jgi:hypothetical protein
MQLRLQFNPSSGQNNNFSLRTIKILSQVSKVLFITFPTLNKYIHYIMQNLILLFILSSDIMNPIHLMLVLLPIALCLHLDRGCFQPPLLPHQQCC